MQRLEAKNIKGRTYYYFSIWGWKNGICRRLSQQYLGKAEDIAQAMQGAGPSAQFAHVLDWGLPVALWQEAARAQIVEQVYCSQFVIEEVFHEMKDRDIGAWWPLHHWTDSKIHIHGLYCTIAVLLRALLWRRASQAGLCLSMSSLLQKLGQIRQVINVYPAKSAGQITEQSELTKRDEIQEKLVQILGLPIK